MAGQETHNPPVTLCTAPTADCVIFVMNSECSEQDSGGFGVLEFHIELLIDVDKEFVHAPANGMIPVKILEYYWLDFLMQYWFNPDKVLNFLAPGKDSAVPGKPSHSPVSYIIEYCLDLLIRPYSISPRSGFDNRFACPWR